MNLPEAVPARSEQRAAPIQVFQVGLGAIGLTIARALEQRPDFEIAGAVSHQVGESLTEIVGPSVPGTVLAELPDTPAAADLCVIATGSTLREIEAIVYWAFAHDMDVISCAEELTLPAAADPAISASLEAAAQAAGKTVLGTGINPGYAMDVLPICLTAPCLNVREVHVRRVNDLGAYGPTVLRAFGIGTTPEAFKEGRASGEIVGHYGFSQSIGMLARALGLRIDAIREEMSPIVATATRRGAHVIVNRGEVAGCLHTAEALSGGRVVIRLEHPQEVDPAAEGTATGDFIRIDGEPPIQARIEPEIAGGIGTAALVVNMARRVVDGPAGLLTMDRVGLPSIAPLTASDSEYRRSTEPEAEEAPTA